MEFLTDLGTTIDLISSELETENYVLGKGSCKCNTKTWKNGHYSRILIKFDRVVIVKRKIRIQRYMCSGCHDDITELPWTTLYEERVISAVQAIYRDIVHDLGSCTVTQLKHKVFDRYAYSFSDYFLYHFIMNNNKESDQDE